MVSMVSSLKFGSNLPDESKIRIFFYWSNIWVIARFDVKLILRNIFSMIFILAKVLKVNGLDTILVVPPLRDDKAHLDLFSSKHFEALYPLIAAFSLVTYDFSNPQRPGANSPLHWIKHAVEHICPDTLTNFKTKRQRILIGMNIYGMDYTLSGGDSGPIVGHQFLDLLKNVKGRLIHDEHDEENFFEIK